MNINFEGKRILVTGAGQGKKKVIEKLKVNKMINSLILGFQGAEYLKTLEKYQEYRKRIGRALALHLAKYKGQVFAISRTKKHLDTLVATDPKIQPICVDLCDWDATRKAVQNILPIDLLVNNAAVACLAPFIEATPEEFDLTFDVNLKAIFNVSQVVGKSMIERKNGGSIVNISSQAGQAALRNHALYCSSKSALDMLSKAMALELGPYNIRVNTVGPTVVMTEMGKLGWSDPQKAQSMIDKIPLGRFAEVHEVVDAVVFLLSDRSSMINGVCLPIDGGFLAT